MSTKRPLTYDPDAEYSPQSVKSRISEYLNSDSSSSSSSSSAGGSYAEPEITVPFIETRSIFVHVPRVAGTSLSFSLYGQQTGHATLRQFLDRNGPETIREYRTFAFVRHPLDRLVSAWEYLRAGGIQTEHDLNAAEEIRGRSFADFVSSWLPSNYQRFFHFQTQFHYLKNNSGKVGVKFVGRFESLEAEFARLCKNLGLSRKELPKLNTSNRHRDWTSYFDDRTAGVTREIYKADFQAFKY